MRRRWIYLAAFFGLLAACTYGLVAALGQGGSASAATDGSGENAGDVILHGVGGAGPGEVGLRQEQGLWGPNSFAVDPQGYIYVADGVNRRIQVFDDAGQFVTAYPYPASGSVRDIGIRRDGVLFIVDTTAEVGLLDPDTRAIDWLEKGDLQSTEAFRIRPTENGRVYIEEKGVEDTDHLVRKYDENLRYLATLAMRDLVTHPYLDMPYGVSSDTGDQTGREVTVSGLDASTMEVEASYISVQSTGGEDLESNRPRLVGVDGQFGIHLLVPGDAARGVSPRILHCTRDGQIRGTTWLDVTLDSDVDIGDDIQQVVVDPGGNLYVSTATADSGFSIWKVPAR